MKLRFGFLLRVSLVILVALAFLIAYWLISVPIWDARVNLARLGPSVTASVEFLIITVLYSSISFWIAFADRGVKGWEKNLMLVGMIIGLFVALQLALLSWGMIISEVPPELDEINPILFNNLSATINFMLMAAGILFVAILGFVLIPKRKSIIEWMKNA